MQLRLVTKLDASVILSSSNPTIVDGYVHAVQKMGMPYPPSYLNPSSRGPIILQGLNYASAAAGILDSTGYNYVSFYLPTSILSLSLPFSRLRFELLVIDE